MSFILDAIAKSEQERQLQEMPGARTFVAPVTNTQKGRRYLPYLFIGVLFLNALLLLIWMQTEWNLPSPIEGMEQTNGQDKIPENVLTTDEIMQIEKMLFKKQSGIRQQGTVENEIHGTNPTQISPPEREPLEAGAPMLNANNFSTGAVKNVLTQEQIAELKISTLPDQSINEQQEGSKSVQQEVPVKMKGGDARSRERTGQDSLSNKTDAEKNIVPEQTDRNTDAKYRQVSSLREIPDEVRKDLPRVVFSGHLYSSNPLSSVVFMSGGRPVKQGQEIEDELYLHEITPTGVIVEFRAYLIKVGVLQDWTLN